jgi:hypothetical protein
MCAQAGPDINERAQDTLKDFCRWQKEHNDPDEDSPNHHDVAILLTRCVPLACAVFTYEQRRHLSGAG